MTNQFKLKHLFERLKSENAPSGIGWFSNGKTFAGRILRNDEKCMVLIGYNRRKQLKIFAFNKEVS